MLQNLFSGPVSSKNRMVGAFCGRFAFATATTVEELRNYSKNENTTKGTDSWLSVWKKKSKIVGKV